MKNQRKLQEKLRLILSKHPRLKVNTSADWDDVTFKQVVWVVNDYVTNSGEVVQEDPLYSWLEEYNFFLTESNAKS